MNGRVTWLGTAAGYVLAGIVAAYALWNACDDYPFQFAYDLYQPWGIAVARDVTGGPVNPYVDTRAVGARVQAKAAQAPEVSERAAAAFWLGRSPATGFEPTGTPFYYALFAWVPRDYATAHLLMTMLQFLSLAAGVYVLGRTRRWSRGTCLLAAAFAWATFNPFTNDVKIANVNSLQFLALALFITAASGALERGRWVDRIFLPALTLFVLAKPNTALVGLALAAHYATVRGPRRFATGAALSCVAVALGIAAGAVYMGSAGAWLDWYRYTQGANGGTLLYTVQEGNLSIPRMIARGADGARVAAYCAAAAVVMGAAMLLALSARGREPARIGPGLRGVLADPWLAASAAIIATFAIAPLAWPHYWVILLIPVLRLFRWHGRWDAATWCTVVAYALLSRQVLAAISDTSAGAAIYTFMMFSWTPLVAALLLEMAHVSRAPQREGVAA